jgi:hypothetical protein
MEKWFSQRILKMKTETFFKLQRRLVKDGPDAPWNDVSSDTDADIGEARETYDNFVSSYAFHHPGRYEFRTVSVTVKTTYKPVVWGRVADRKELDDIEMERAANEVSMGNVTY